MSSDRARLAFALKAERGPQCQCDDCLLEEAIAWARSRESERPKARHEFDAIKLHREWSIRKGPTE